LTGDVGRGCGDASRAQVLLKFLKSSVRSGKAMIALPCCARVGLLLHSPLRYNW
jgi:hypothetical protein